MMGLVEFLAWAWALSPAFQIDEDNWEFDDDENVLVCLRCGQRFDPSDLEEIQDHECW